MTEAEAKTKWCPFARAEIKNGGSAVNRSATMGNGWPGDIEHTTRCLGSGCMAWQYNRFRQVGRCGLLSYWSGAEADRG